MYIDRAGFSIEFPPSWQVRTRVAGLAVVALPDESSQTGNVGVVVENLGRADLTVELYLQVAQARAPEQIDRFQVVSCAVRDVGGRRQGVLHYTGSVRGRPLRFLATVVVSEGRAFVATFTAPRDSYEALLPSVEPVLRSLRRH